MKRAFFAAACLAAALLAGCAPVGATPAPEDSASSGAPATTSGAPPPSSEDLTKALLTAKDLPTGFVQAADTSNGNGAVGIGGGGFPGCAPLNTPLTTTQTMAAAVTFAKGVVGPYVTHAVLRYPAGGATAALTRLTEAQTSCPAFSQEMAGFTVKFQLKPAGVPPLGDQAVGLRMTGVTDGFNIAVVADIAAIRRGDVVIWLSDMSMGTTAASMVDELARAAVARCAATLPDCATPR